jgi:trehalose 6-phosphate synthase
VGAELISDDRDGSTRLLHAAVETEAAAVPIGIDVDDFERIARLPEVASRARRLRADHGGRRILFSADRLDYTKGIIERFHVLERFLASRPHAGGRIVLIQVVVPSRHQVEEYRVMKREIDREVGRINGEHGREGWVPIHYRYQALERDELVAHYLAADVALVTPLRDGMNLVAAEFAASRVDEDGILVVSEFAGIAERSPGAILVNPYDVERCVAAIGSGLDMDPVERRDRMNRLRERVRSNPASRWAARCLGPPELRARGWALGSRSVSSDELADVEPMVRP